MIKELVVTQISEVASDLNTFLEESFNREESEDELARELYELIKVANSIMETNLARVLACQEDSLHLSVREAKQLSHLLSSISMYSNVAMDLLKSHAKLSLVYRSLQVGLTAKLDEFRQIQLLGE